MADQRPASPSSSSSIAEGTSCSSIATSTPRGRPTSGGWWVATSSSGEDFDKAAHRELLEETGVVAGPGELVLWQEAEFAYSDGHDGSYRLYAGQLDLTDDDIVLGEGRAIVFVDPAELGSLDLAESCAHFVPLFLASDLYRQLRDEGNTR